MLDFDQEKVVTGPSGALLIGVRQLQELQLVLEQLDPGAGGTFTWLDPRNASLAVLPGGASLPVRVLLEIRERGEMAVLATSRGVLERVLMQQPSGVH